MGLRIDDVAPDFRKGSTVRVRCPSESGRPSGSNPTLRPDGRQSVGFGTYNRLGLNGYFVPKMDMVQSEQASPITASP
jgi:hypothetical protein